MTLDYILLLGVFFFPFLYKVGYWWSIFQDKTFNVSQLYHFWIYIEIPLFLWTFTLIIDPLYEIFLYNIIFYFLLLYNIFVFWRIFRKKFYFPKTDYKSLFSLLLLIIVSGIFIYIDSKWIYSVVTWIMLLTPLFYYIMERLQIVIRKVILKNN